MTDSNSPKPDLLESARQLLTQIVAEFDQALETVKDPERRRQATESALEKLQSALSTAQQSIAKYQDRIAHDKPNEADPPEADH